LIPTYVGTVLIGGWRGSEGLVDGVGRGSENGCVGMVQGVTGQGVSGARIRAVRPGVQKAEMGCGRNVGR
ncbi:MAG TPA: hypothetical protein VM243_17430, partial [Phycisphaerae bacterium]|nr:hypothetical protein [Phycisphaerae bacterium]